jgi:hypothetical protein
MKIVKIENHYFIMEKATICEGDYTWDGEMLYKLIKDTRVSKEGWKVLGTTDEYYSELAIMKIEDLEKPLVFEPKDMMKYSNWVLEWCSMNKYRKTLGGVKPFGQGAEYTDEELFNLFLESFNKIETENVEAFINDGIVNIIKM